MNPLQQLDQLTTAAEQRNERLQPGLQDFLERTSTMTHATDLTEPTLGEDFHVYEIENHGWHWEGQNRCDEWCSEDGFASELEATADAIASLRSVLATETYSTIIAVELSQGKHYALSNELDENWTWSGLGLFSAYHGAASYPTQDDARNAAISDLAALLS